MKKVSLVFASLAMVAFVACNNAEEAPVTEEVIEVVEETPVVEEEVMVEEVADSTMMEATEEAM